ncbi:MAG: hypothetical protein IJF59_01065 [Clostridia bacterium]|nr:hypothetical protein [Clostridia bacterium]MBQ3077749.1 hypothetical protein [Clostridia bacterium]
MTEPFTRWMPHPRCVRFYDLIEIESDRDGICFTLRAERARPAHILTLTWHGLLHFSVSDELYRPDCWFQSPEQAESLFVAQDSPLLRQMRRHSPWLGESLLHYRLICSGHVAELIASEPPLVGWREEV